MFKLFNFFKNKKTEPKSEWVEFVCTVRHVVRNIDLDQNDKIDLIYSFRYDPVTDILQARDYIHSKIMEKNNREGKWKNVYLSDYKNAVLIWDKKPFDIFKKVDDIKRDYYEKHKAEFREDSINDILNGIN